MAGDDAVLVVACPGNAVVDEIIVPTEEALREEKFQYHNSFIIIIFLPPFHILIKTLLVSHSLIDAALLCIKSPVDMRYYQ